MRRLLCVILSVGLAACQDGVATIDGPYAGILVQGVVRDPAGAPVPGAAVRIEWRATGSCASLGDRHESTVTDSVGRFGRALGDFGTPHDICVRLVVTPPAGYALRPDSVTRGAVRLEAHLDSVRIDVQLPPSA